MATETLSIECPVLGFASPDRIMLAHGEGGRLMRKLIHEQIIPRLDNEYLRLASDAAALPACSYPLAVSTDSYVVSPLFFPGGDIGSLAVYGTANDLAVAGAKPKWLSLSLILEEGLEVDILEQVLTSIATATERVGVGVVTGDTKVVPRGAVDKMFINTTGIGEFTGMKPVGAGSLEVGDELIVSGPIGRHGIAVMAAREGLEFDPLPMSDSAPLWDAISALQQANVCFRAARDLTRGGLGAVLHEWAETSGKTLSVDENLLPVTPEVRGVCELLGLDPIHVANEGTMLLAIPAGQTDKTLRVLRSVRETEHAASIGFVEAQGLAAVLVKRGAQRMIPLDEPMGAPLPRIC